MLDQFAQECEAHAAGGAKDGHPPNPLVSVEVNVPVGEMDALAEAGEGRRVDLVAAGAKARGDLAPGPPAEGRYG